MIPRSERYVLHLKTTFNSYTLQITRQKGEYLSFSNIAVQSVFPDPVCSPEFAIKTIFSEKAHNQGFLQLPSLLFYLPIGKGSEMEVKIESAEE